MMDDKIAKIIDGFRIPWNSPVNVKDVYYAIQEYATSRGTDPAGINWGIVDGILCANREKVKRVGPKDPRRGCSARAAYWEGRILERQEAWMD